MKQSMLVLALLALGVPAYAQIGGLGQGLKRAQQVKDAKDKFDDLNVTEEEERKIGEDVSAKIRQRFGVVQSVPIHKYVTLVGTALAQQSERPKLNWTFIVLDTDGVNAFASPGGIVHITRGALGLIRNEAELAGVLAHEIGHVAHKHTVNAIRKNKMVQLGTSETLADRGAFLDKLANKAYEMVVENSFDKMARQVLQITDFAARQSAAAQGVDIVLMDDLGPDLRYRGGEFIPYALGRLD